MPKTILVAEDEKDLSSVLSARFKDEGYRVLVAGDGEVAISMALEENPDLILLDIIMPKIDGASVLKRLRQEEVTKQTPIILLSNLSSGEKVDQAKDQDVTDYLIKTDWSIDDIVDRVKRALSTAPKAQV